MQTKRLLLIPFGIASLGIVFVAACGGGKSYKATSYPTTNPAVQIAEVATTAAGPTALVAVATATPEPPAPTSTLAPPPPPPAAPAVVQVANTPVPPPPPAPAPPPPPPAAPSPATLSLTIADFNFALSPATVKAGQPVTVNVRNSGSATHTFSLQSGPSTGNVAGGTSTVLQFTAPSQPETISFRCMIHASMTGQITVTN